MLDSHNHKQHVTHLLLGWQAHRVLRRWRLVSIWCVPSRHWLGRWLIPRGLEPRLGRWVPGLEPRLGRWVPGLEPRLKRLVPGLERSLGRWVLGWFIHWWSWWTRSLRFYGSCGVRRPPKKYTSFKHVAFSGELAKCNNAQQCLISFLPIKASLYYDFHITTVCFCIRLLY